jgi:hypothetical protein
VRIDSYLKTFYLTTSRFFMRPQNDRKRKLGRSASIRSMGLGRSFERNVGQMQAARVVI